MNRKTYWLSALLALALTPWTDAMADGYWIRFKDANGTLIPGVTGGFSYANPTQIADQGVCQEDGQTVVVNITIPANAIGNPQEIVFNTNLVAPKPLICRTHSWKDVSGARIPPGTKQCLDNATHVSGVSGTIKTGKGQPYTLQFQSDAANILTRNGCGNNNENPPPITFTPTGDFEPSYHRAFTITGPGNFSLSGAYWVVNQVHATPEPGSLVLLLAGLGGFGLLSWSRRRGARLTR